MSTFLHRLWIGGVLVALCMPVAMAQTVTSRDLTTQNIDRIDGILQRSDDALEQYPLPQLYEQVLQDAVQYPKVQTSVEFERRFNEKAPSFGSALQDATTLSGNSAAGQAITKTIKEEEERRMFGRNMRFLDVYLVGKYMGMFMNGDRADSSYDIFLDVVDIHEMLTGEAETASDALPPRFSAGISQVGRYLKGATVQAVEISDADRNNRIRQLIDSGSVKFNESGIPVCALPEVVQNGSVTALDADTRKAILGRLVDLEEISKTAQQVQNNNELLNREPERNFFERFLAGENVPLPNMNGCAFDMFCARLDFIKTVPRLAPGRIGRPLPIMVSLESIEEVVKKLSNTPLETKRVSKSAFSYSFVNLKLGDYRMTSNFEARAVPIFQAYDASKAFSVDTVDQLITNYNSILLGDLNRTTSTAINPDRLPGSQVLTDAARQAYIDAQKAQYKSTMLLRTMIYWNAVYLKVVGDRTLQLQQQVSHMGHQLSDLAGVLKELNEGAVTLYNEGS